ncbi:MAG: GYDIA family GHMP kinase [Bacteroidia bacterium]
MQIKQFYAHGKLLLTGEYVVLQGATALAVPTKLGQWLEVHQKEAGQLWWQARDHEGKMWFEARFELPFFEIRFCTNQQIATRLQRLLMVALDLQPTMEAELSASLVQTRLEFNRDWGLGSSSSLVSLVAQWFGVEPMALFAQSQAGSGYDVACATAEGPILFRRNEGQISVQAAAFNPVFREHLLFVYLGQKQISSLEVRRYLASKDMSAALIQQINGLTQTVLHAADLAEFSDAMVAHEELLAEQLHREPVKELHFADFPGEVKSLGAWGGDFVLAMAPDIAAANAWLQAHRYPTVFSYDKLI